jgi:uracil-DNA glycosylase
MKHDYDTGYGLEPFKTLCNNHPDAAVYPQKDFRTEWGPIFHRGRLDGSARLLVIGQDPAAHESIVRRILMGEAGQRVQGFMAKLGMARSYVMINTFLYSVYGQQGGEKHKDDKQITAYRNRWLDALILGQRIEAVVTLGGMAAEAWNKWRSTPKGKGVNLPWAKMMHPTYPESSAKGDPAKLAANTKKLLENWNEALTLLHAPIKHPDVSMDPVLYGEVFQLEDLAEIPECDVPAGIPEWMRGLKAWAARTGETAAKKRATITVKIPSDFLPD